MAAVCQLTWDKPPDLGTESVVAASASYTTIINLSAVVAMGAINLSRASVQRRASPIIYVELGFVGYLGEVMGFGPNLGPENGI